MRDLLLTLRALRVNRRSLQTMLGGQGAGGDGCEVFSTEHPGDKRE